MSRRPRHSLESVLGRLDDLDETNRHNLVQRLARERRLLEAVLQTVREGILVTGPDGIIAYANPAAARLLGFALKDLGKVSLWKQVPDLARSLHITADGEWGGGAGLSREIELRYPERRHVRLYFTPIANAGETEDSNQPRYAVILSDVTDDKASAQQEIENERIQSILQLAAGVAHELGNPLNSLTIHLQLMQRKIDSVRGRSLAASLTKSLGVCLAEVKRLDGIITHFLQAVRPVRPDFSKADLLELLSETLEFLRPEMEDADISVEVELADPPPPVMADRNQIKQVLFNILKNAREAMTAGGRVKIRTRSDDEFIYLMIADTGAGISEENLNRVFQPYFSTKTGGSGLGLMIVERIMRAHGGQIGIDSRVDRGTVVTLQFPQIHRRTRLLESGAPSSSPTL